MAQSGGDAFHSEADTSATPAAILPTPDIRYRTETEGVSWAPLLRQTWYFLNIQHGFRLATETGTRSGMTGRFFAGYERSLRSLHGWSDGDPLYVNYIGHPMMGSATGMMWAQNDRRYRDAEFGRDPAYWKRTVRAAAYSFAYSAQFEIGPYSEASIGKIQSRWPAQGLVDLVVTPVIGTGWMIAEDAIDQLLIRRIERWNGNNWVRIFARAGLNPTRTAANALGGKMPWHRETRTGVYAPYSYVSRPESVDPRPPVLAPEGVAPVEISATVAPTQFLGDDGGVCKGGGGSAAFRLARQWQLVVDVSGCKMTQLEPNLSGDVLAWLVGPRWKAAGDRRFSPHLQFLVGGQKVSQERIDPDMLEILRPTLAKTTEPQRYRKFYADQEHKHALAVSAGGGLDLKFSDALAVRLASLEYRRSWSRPMLNGVAYNEGLQFSTGIILRMGTW